MKLKVKFWKLENCLMAKLLEVEGLTGSDPVALATKNGFKIWPCAKFGLNSDTMCIPNNPGGVACYNFPSVSDLNTWFSNMKDMIAGLNNESNTPTVVLS